jgi:HK97 family phage portal protein
MTFWQRFFGVKESQARIVTTMNQIGKPQVTPANYEAFANTGFGKSAIVYRCVSMIAGAARGMSFDLYNVTKRKNPVELETHPFLDLWKKPNPMQSTHDFIENLVAFYVLDGNSYVEANRGASKTSVPLEIWNVRPDKMKVVPGPGGYPASYIFEASGIKREWLVDVVNMTSDILHWKTFHPLNDWYGMSPLQAAILSLDQNLAGQRWNLALLQNSATPSGVLQVKVTDSNPRGELTDEQYKRMREDYETNYQGVRNTGKPMIIEGGLTWTQMSFSPKDVDYSKGKEISATDIALCFGVPPELLGLGQKTFNNYREARLSFYEETVLPIMDAAMGSINRWLAPAFGDNICLEYDKDDIEILQWKREQRYTSLANVNFLNQNEKRVAVGFEPAEGWDVFVIGTAVGAMPEDFKASAPAVPDPNDPNANDPEDGTVTDPAAKPKPTEDDPGDDPDTEPQGIADGKGWKSINLVSRGEKVQSWKAQNNRRKRLQTPFERDVKSDFAELVYHLKKVKGHVHDPKLTEFALIKTVSDFMPTMHKTIKRHIRYACEDFGGMILGEGKSAFGLHDQKANTKFQHFVDVYTEDRSGQAIKTITSTTTKQMRKIVGEWVNTAIEDGDSNSDLSKYIGSEFEELTPEQSTRIARTEVALASNNAALEAVKSLQVPNMFKEWVTANDDRVRDGAHGGADHTAMDGTEVALDEQFSVPPDSSMDGPGDDSAPADQVINCRCVLTYRSKN